jgi:hypothetical protein
MNWNNIKENKCPKCERKLCFRLKGSKINIKANENLARTIVKDDYYFCSHCDGFKITSKRLQEVKKNLNKKTLNGIPQEDKKLFSSVILKL